MRNPKPSHTRNTQSTNHAILADVWGEMNDDEAIALGNFLPGVSLLLFILAFSLRTFSREPGQQKTKKVKSKTPTKIPCPCRQSPPPINSINNIGEMLGAWQVGDVDAMHKFYADDATFTSGAFEPPIVGFQNYVASYQKARTQFRRHAINPQEHGRLLPHGLRLGFLSMGITGYGGGTTVQRARTNDAGFRQDRRQMAHRPQSHIASLRRRRPCGLSAAAKPGN